MNTSLSVGLRTICPEVSTSSTISSTKTKWMLGAGIGVAVVSLLWNRDKIINCPKQRMIKNIQSFRTLIESGTFRTMPLKEFEGFIKALRTIPTEHFQRLFLPIPLTSDASSSLLFINCSSKLLIIFKYIPLDKLDILFKQLSQEQLALVLSQKMAEEVTFLHVACVINNQEFIHFILNQIPRAMLEKFLQAPPGTLSPFIYSIDQGFDDSVLALANYAKERGILPLLLNQERVKGVRFAQYFCAHGKTTLLMSILKLLNPAEQCSVLALEDLDNKFDQPLMRAIFYKQFGTLEAVLRLLPHFLFHTYYGQKNLAHSICLFGTHEFFEVINRHLITHGYDIKESWKKLLMQKDSQGLTPIDLLAQRLATIGSTSILTLQEIEKCLHKHDYENLIYGRDFIVECIRNGNFDLASYIIEQNPSIIFFCSSTCRETIWHALTSISRQESLLPLQRVAFFLKHFNTTQLKLLNQIDYTGATPLSNAYFSGLKEIVPHLLHAGAKPISEFSSIYSSKLLAHVWSIEGSVDHGSESYQLESWHSFYVMQAVYKALKAFYETQSVDSDLLEAFSVFDLPAEEQQEKMLERASQGKIWIKPIVVGSGFNDHQLAFVGSPTLILLVDTGELTIHRKDGVIQELPARIQPFNPSPQFSYEALFSISPRKYLNFYDLFSDLIKSYHLKALPYYPFKTQMARNCTYRAAEACVFAYQGLLEDQKNRSELKSLLLKDSYIKQIFDCSKPFYKGFAAFNRWHHLKDHTSIANSHLIAAIESKALVQFALKEIKKVSPLSPFSLVVSYLPRDDSFHVDLSATKDRLEFIQHLYSLKIVELNQQMSDFIREKELIMLRDLIKEMI